MPLGDAVTIDIAQATDNVSKVTIHIGTSGDEAVSKQLIDKIKKAICLGFDRSSEATMGAATDVFSRQVSSFGDLFHMPRVDSRPRTIRNMEPEPLWD